MFEKIREGCGAGPYHNEGQEEVDLIYAVHQPLSSPVLLLLLDRIS